MLDTFTAFLDAPDAREMFITGQAGTGKTTSLATLVEYCMYHDIEHVVCAYTHKACNILRSKLPSAANVQTLHKYLRKRPGINTNASKVKEIDTTIVAGLGQAARILFVDEYSMVGERDSSDILAAKGLTAEGRPQLAARGQTTKVVWLGDPNQLPPVGDKSSVVPRGDYTIFLTKIYRQAADNPLMAPLNQLVSFIDGTAKPHALIESEKFIRNQDIVRLYNNNTNPDKAMLAFTNRRVQDLNILAQGYDSPKPGDRLFSPTTKQYYTFKSVSCPRADHSTDIDIPFGKLDPKYRTLDFLRNLYPLAIVEDDDGEEFTFMYVFGHYNYKIKAEELKKAAAEANNAIGPNAAAWARVNKGTPKARARAQAWRAFLSFDQAVICLDFAHATTVHKSQGSTYNCVYLDTDDIGIAATMDYTMYLKLMYVGISRAADTVVTT